MEERTKAGEGVDHGILRGAGPHLVVHEGGYWYPPDGYEGDPLYRWARDSGKNADSGWGGDDGSIYFHPDG